MRHYYFRTADKARLKLLHEEKEEEANTVRVVPFHRWKKYFKIIFIAEITHHSLKCLEPKLVSNDT